MDHDDDVEMKDANSAIDESLYSRQLYVMGHEAQRKMGNSTVLIIGLRGLGVEIAKNVILAGVKGVVLHDDQPVEIADLSAQFYFKESDVGTPRAAACVGQLSELNNYVDVSVGSGTNCLSDMSKYACVCVTDQINSDLKLQISDACHAANTPYVQGDMRGLFASMFCDFGSNFIVNDTDGEQPMTVVISAIDANSDEAVVTSSEGNRHGLSDGMFVTFSEVPGSMGQHLNGCAPRPIKVINPFTFSIGSTQGLGTFDVDCGIPGMANQVKMPKSFSFQSLRTSLTQPGDFTFTDFAKWDRPGLLHQAFRGLDEFTARNNGVLPTPGSMKDANELYSLTARVNAESKENDFSIDNEQMNTDASKRIVQQLAMGARGQLSPVAAAVGGIVGQEVLKACSSKFMPMKQWCYFDAIECLPDGDAWPLAPEEYTPTNTRYDGQIAVFGKTYQQKIQDLSLFLVGAGAIGCEMLKNWSLMGVASSTSTTSQIHITDMDTIEKSNLNRQFLFRPKDVGQCKSTTAALAAMAMNGSVRVKSYEDRVGADTESTFSDDFFAGVDGVVTALDNVEARLYVDQRCMYYRKPMIDSGTLGTKGNTQVVLPYQSENWGASRDPPEASIPICTLKNFPHKIEHTIQWARDFFEGTFTQAAMDVNQYLTNDQFLVQLDSQQNTKIDTLERLKASLVDHMPKSFEECIAWSRLNFEKLFLATPCQLLHNFPKDQKTQSGQPFWSGHKRAPEALRFDPNDEAHMAFIVAASNLRAFNYGITGTRDLTIFTNTLATVQVPVWQAKQVKIAANEEEAKKMEEERAGSMDVDEVANRLIGELPLPGKLAGYKMHPADFEKDDDSNFHMDFMTACSNLRARNYRIQEANAHKTKQIAGKIIPAIATTTAMVTGLVCMELYKIVQNKKFEDFKNAYANLALPLFTFSEPAKVSKNTLLTKDGPWEWSEAWDRIDINDPNMTLNEFLEHIEAQYHCEVQMLSQGVTILHSFFFPPSKVNERKAMKLEDVAAQFSLKRPLTPNDKYLVFEVCACKADDYPAGSGDDDEEEDEDDDDLNLPYVRFKTSM